jgi:gluconokinase
MILIVMGVVGSGKTTVGRLLAEQLHYEFADADDFHPQSNIEKISHGIALSDEDREPWLQRLRERILTWEADGTNAVLACSALKSSYREILKARPDVRFIFLKGSAALIAQRLSSRHGHFAGASILASQMADLEEPADAITVDIAQTPPEIVAEIRQKLELA